jgi:hypothetical protein
MARARQVDAFLLSREWHDGVEVVLWARAVEAPVRARFVRQEAVMFVPRHAEARADRRASPRLATLDGKPVDALYFRARRAAEPLLKPSTRPAGGCGSSNRA